MGKRSDFSAILNAIPGVKKVYFQPPESVRMEYPCIRYSKNDESNLRADNILYVGRTRYEVIVIDTNPDSPICDEISKIPYASFSRWYPSDNLNHFVYTIYF